jgi:hypothetical protein
MRVLLLGEARRGFKEFENFYNAAELLAQRRADEELSRLTEEV